MKTPAGVQAKWLKDHETYSGDDCLIWPFFRGEKGYGRIRRGKRKEPAHREMCIAVHGPAPSSEHETAHLCGKGHLGCCHPKHLTWKTKAENAADRLVHGTDGRGEKNPRAKLTRTEVIEIRASSHLGRPALAKKYQVHHKTITDILHRKIWAWLEETPTEGMHQ